jgi:hypothetical protein
VAVINVPVYAEQIAAIKNQLFSELAASGALNMQAHTPTGDRLDQRKLSRSP